MNEEDTKIIEWATNEIGKAITAKFYGSLQFNFADGKITNMNRLQSVKPKTEKREGRDETI